MAKEKWFEWELYSSPGLASPKSVLIDYATDLRQEMEKDIKKFQAITSDQDFLAKLRTTREEEYKLRVQRMGQELGWYSGQIDRANNIVHENKLVCDVFEKREAALRDFLNNEVTS